MNIFSKIKKFLSEVGKFRVITDPSSYKYPAFIVQVRGLFWWHIVKIFISDDTEYAKMCAYELLETLEEDIEPKPAKQ